MKLELEIYDSFCTTRTFTINGIRADGGDFGYSFDNDPDDPDNAEDYGCGDRTFVRKPATQAVLAKYRITPAEYALVAGQLEVGLSFGRCGWCA